MKTWLGVGLLLGLTSAATFGQGAQADQIKRRARNVAEQNNARQGVPPSPPPKSAPAQRPVASPPVAAAAPQLSPEQKRVAIIRVELASLAVTNSAEARKRLSKSLLTAAHGAGKPTGAATDQLGERLAAAMAGAKFTPAQLDRLAQNLDGAMNSSGMPKTQTDAIADDVKAVLEKAGGGRPPAATVAVELKRITAEIQKAAGR